jgi:hypothetical protein
MTKIIRVKKEANYTVIDNNIFQDKTLSLPAIGLLTYILSKPDDWSIYPKYLETVLFKKQNSKASYKYILELLTELEDFGYVQKKRLSTGHMEYFVYENPNNNDFEPKEDIEPNSEKPNEEKQKEVKKLEPNSEKPNEEKAHLQKTENIINTNSFKTNTISKTNELPQEEKAQNISFDDWYKDYPRKRGKTRAELLFKKLRKKDFDILQEATALYADEVKGRDPKHILQADSFLSQKKFNDYRDDIENQRLEEQKSQTLKEKTASLIQKILLFAKEREKTPMKMRDFKTNEGAAVFSEFDVGVLGYAGVNESIFQMGEDELYEMLVNSVSFMMDKKVNINNHNKEK